MLILLELLARSRLLRSGGILVAAILSGTAGCASPGSLDSNPSPTTGGTDSSDSGDGDGDTSAPASITFAERSTLALSPLGVAEITVDVSPALGQTVTFEILAGDATFDGFLVGNTAFVDEYGSATIELHAPNQVSSFSVRAALTTGEEARRLIEVSDQGFGLLKVSPDYSGTRKVKTWHASVWPGLGCDDLDNLFIDSNLIGRGNGELKVEQVPAGTLMAVTMRGDQVVGGCVTVSDISTDQELEVIVPIVDRPIDPNSGTLNISISSATDEFAALFENSISDSVEAFVENYSGDGAALLELIKAELPAADVVDFEDAVVQYDLETVAASSLASPTAVSEQIRAILAAASTQVVGDDILLGELELHGLKSEFSLITALGIDSEAAGFAVPDFWQVEIETGDTVALGGEIIYNPSLWLGELAEDQAKQSETADPVTLLQKASNCESLANNLLLASGNDTLAQCDQKCLVSACMALASSLWDQVKGSGADAVLVIGASGSATVHGHATIETLDCSWVGKTNDMKTSLKGALSGSYK